MNKFVIPFIPLFVLFSYLLLINIYVLEGIPHVPDSVAYIFMSKMLASGHINSPIPIPAQFVDFFPEILSVKQGTWLFQYPLGHPLLLAVGELLHMPSLVPPFLGAFTILILYLIARMTYDNKTSVILLFIPFFSPFFLENSASFMSHTTAAFYAVASVYFLVLFYKNRQTFIFPFISGLSIGFLLNTRPLTALPFFFLLFGYILLAKRDYHLKAATSFLGGFSLLFIFWMIYNLMTTGSLVTSQYFIANQQLFAFSDQNVWSFFMTRLGNMHSLFDNLSPMLYNLPGVVTFSVPLIPFFVQKKSSWSILFLLFCLGIPITYFFYNGTFIMYGPRFWYEITPFFFLLTARAASYLMTRYPRIYSLLFLVLAVVSWYRFWGVLPTKDPSPFSPLRIQKLQGFNYTDSRIKKLVAKHAIHHAVVFVADCHGNWWCYGSVFSENNATLSTDVVYVKDLGAKNIGLKKYYPDRIFYHVDYNQAFVEKL
ncbi:MAG: glycosyltransferase family 39 protein [Nitrospiria bacterium]